jgi:hypothetical protein
MFKQTFGIDSIYCKQFSDKLTVLNVIKIHKYNEFICPASTVIIVILCKVNKICVSA